MLSGLPPEDDAVQAPLRWVRDNYTTDNGARIGDGRSHYYYLWASAKAFEVVVGNQPGALYADQIGGLIDPSAVGYPQESARWYFDYAWFLINDQSQNGQWCSNGVPCWNAVSATSYAILVLARSLGGVCLLDEDADELCAQEDNCPNIANPDQADTDMDGVGDACDNCFDVPNPDQTDADNDTVGDACDPLICTQETENTDPCDARDNDCDGNVDEDALAMPEQVNDNCATGQPGICDRGSSACLNGEYSCVPYFMPTTDSCDGLDNDCDGTIDEGVTNACGRCGGVDPDICDGEDNNCDGQVDEDPNGTLCPNFRVCFEGQCRAPCDVECPDLGTICVPEQNLCLEPCEGVTCEYGLTCQVLSPTVYQCQDLCAGVECPEGERCWDGACVPDTCVYTGCPDGSICDGVECRPDVCASLNCEPGQFCRGGQCVPSCAQVSCPLYQSCVDGLCVEDACGGVRCGDGEVCLEGACVSDPCVGVTCAGQQTCLNGQCVFDACDGVLCPPGQACEVQRAGAQCVRTWDVAPPAPPSDDMGPPTGPSAGAEGPIAPMAGTSAGAGGAEPTAPAKSVSGVACSQQGGRGAVGPLHLLALVALAGLARRRRGAAL